MNTKPLGPFLGVNNRLPDFDLNVRTRDVKGTYVRSATDVVLTGSGTFVSRKSCDRLQAVSGAHSLFGGYLVRAGVLYKVTLPNYSETLVKLLTSNAQGDWLALGTDYYFSNGVDRLRIDSNGVVRPWGMPTPNSPDGVSSVSGTLTPGWYQIAVAYVNEATGEEGGVSASCNYYLGEEGGLSVPLPGAEDGATHVVLYVGRANGEVPTAFGTYPIGTASVTVTYPADGRPAPQRYEEPLPAGDQLFYYNGRLCSIAGNVVYYGLSYRPGYYIPVDGRIPFPADVSVVMPAQNGIYVAADKTYWFPGDIEKLTDQIQDVLPYGAVKGTGFSAPNKTVYGWFGEKGIVLGSAQGEVEAAMSDNITLTPPASGVSFIVEDSVSRRVVSCGWCLNLDTKAATSFTGYSFTSVSGRYATKGDGIYDIEGDGDVPGVIDFGKNDFGTEQLTRLPAVYLGVASVNPMSLTISYVDQDEVARSYTYAARKVGSLALRRVDPGKGIRASWVNLTLSGVNFTLASASFAPADSKRRI